MLFPFIVIVALSFLCIFLFGLYVNMCDKYYKLKKLVRYNWIGQLCELVNDLRERHSCERKVVTHNIEVVKRVVKDMVNSIYGGD